MPVIGSILGDRSIAWRTSGAMLIHLVLLFSQSADARRDADSALAAGESPEEARLLEASARLEARIAEQGLLFGDWELDRYLLNITDRLVVSQAGMENPPEVRIRTTGGTAPLALSLANGAIYLSIGMLACLETDAQVAMVIAAEVSRVLSREQVRRLADDKSRANARFLPELLSAFALGLADRSLRQQEVEFRQAYEEQLDLDADAAGLEILRAAGYSAAEVPKVFTNLAAMGPTLAKDLSGPYGNPARLEARRLALSGRLMVLTDAERNAGESGAEGYPIFRRKLLLALAQRLARSGSFTEGRIVLDRRDAVFGPDGPGAYLRAVMARQTARSPADQDVARAALVTATNFSDVPVEAFRDLGFAHRRRGEASLAAAAFAEYLRRNPEAIDAPILRGYLEKP